MMARKSRYVFPVLALLLATVCAHGQFVLTKEQMIAYTSDNPYERFEDGRPKVPDALLEKVKGLVIEEAYGAVKSKGFPNQFAGTGRSCILARDWWAALSQCSSCPPDRTSPKACRMRRPGAASAACGTKP